MEQQLYDNGFIDRCNQYGVNPEQLIKAANEHGLLKPPTVEKRAFDLDTDAIKQYLLEHSGDMAVGAGAGGISSLAGMNSNDSILKNIAKLLAGTGLGAAGGIAGGEGGQAVGESLGARARPLVESITGGSGNPLVESMNPLYDARNKWLGSAYGRAGGAGIGGAGAGIAGSKLVDLLSSLV